VFLFKKKPECLAGQRGFNNLADLNRWSWGFSDQAILIEH